MEDQCLGWRLRHPVGRALGAALDGDLIRGVEPLVSCGTASSRSCPHAGVPIERISRLAGRNGTTATEVVYRKQIRPVIVHGADVMDWVFPREADPDV